MRLPLSFPVMQLLPIISAFFGRKQATRRPGIDFEDLADMQAAFPRKNDGGIGNT